MESPESCRSSSSHAKWTIWDIFRWKALSEQFGGGHAYLQAFKDGWISYNQDKIKAAAARFRIPAILLASVAWAEVGGKPDGFKKPVFFDRYVADHFRGKPVQFGKPSGRTSFGAVSIQLTVAAKELGLSLERMSFTEQLDLITCLETDTFNLEIVARHLASLLSHDNPNADTLAISTEQFIVVGSRSNRGVERSLKDIQQSIGLPPGSVERSYSEYGRRLVEHRDHVAALIGLP